MVMVCGRADRLTGGMDLETGVQIVMGELLIKRAFFEMRAEDV